MPPRFESPSSAPLFPPDRPLARSQLLNSCSRCNTTWHACRCAPDLRTESVQTLLSNRTLFPKTRHLSIFIFFPYIRHAPLAQDDDFSVVAMPQWEGWYSVWLKPSTSGPQLMSWSKFHVYPVQIMFHNATYLDGAIDHEGELFAHVPAGAPVGGDGYDAERGLVRVRMQVSFRLTEDEIVSGKRGWVRRVDGRIDKRKRVSHVVGKREDEQVFLVELVNGRKLEVEENRVLEKGKAFWEEWNWRERRRFTKSQGKVLQLYIKEMMQKAERRDSVARRDRDWDVGDAWREVKRLKVMMGVGD